MNPVIEISLCLFAWMITLLRARSILINRIWKTDLVAFKVWLGSLCFALTMTFLVTSWGIAIDRQTFPNFSRVAAYSFVSLTLYLIASSILVTFPTLQNQRQLRFLKTYLIATLISLVVVYILFVSQTPEWEEGPIPASMAEMAFKLVMFTYAASACTIMAIAYSRYLSREHVIVTKYRIAAITFTAIGGGAFFFTKIILALGYLWHPLSSEWIHSLSKILMVGTSILWVGSFLHSNLYVKALALSRGIRYWAIYQDLISLVDKLERLCPPVGMSMSRPDFWHFLRNSDYYIYRAMVHILDSKTLIADFLDDTIPMNKLRARWDQNGYLEATRLNTILREIKSNDDYLEMISAYRLAGRKLASG